MSLEEMQARCDAATPGPWKAGRSDMTSYGGMDGEPYKNVYGTDHYPHPNMPGEMVPVARGETERCHENAAFIAHARTDMPRLIAALRVAMEGLERANASLDETFSHFNKSSLQVVAGTQLGIAAAIARVAAILEGK